MPLTLSGPLRIVTPAIAALVSVELVPARTFFVDRLVFASWAKRVDT
jgi:hypothetical protein